MQKSVFVPQLLKCTPAIVDGWKNNDLKGTKSKETDKKYEYCCKIHCI